MLYSPPAGSGGASRAGARLYSAPPLLLTSNVRERHLSSPPTSFDLYGAFPHVMLPSALLPSAFRPLQQNSQSLSQKVLASLSQSCLHSGHCRWSSGSSAMSILPYPRMMTTPLPCALHFELVHVAS